MPGVPCRYCGGMLDSYGEFCGCPGSVEARTPAPSPITTKRAAAAVDEMSQHKDGIIMPARPMGDSSTQIELDPEAKRALSY